MTNTPPSAGLFRIPPDWEWPDRVKGIMVGGCIRMSGKHWQDPDHAAHAHARRDDPDVGWICTVIPEFVIMEDGKPHPAMIHELGHIITGQAHTQSWARVVRNWGGIVMDEEIEPYVCARYTRW